MRLTPAEAKAIVKRIKLSEGFVTAVVQDWRTGEVLMVGHQNEEAVIKTLTSGLMHYWSRSRNKLWLKGEVSGHHQELKAVRVDCDGDALLYRVEQIGGACHEGYRSCFYRELRGGKLVHVLKRVFRPEDVYGDKPSRRKSSRSRRDPPFV